MSRVKKGIVRHKKRERILKKTKGFRWGRKKLVKQAREALLHAGVHAFRGRKQKKRDFRSLWQVKINAGAREAGLKYSTFIHALKKKNIILDRKILAHLAEHEPNVFQKIVDAIK